MDPQEKVEEGSNPKAIITSKKYEYKMNFPRASNYSNMADIVQVFPHLKYVNSETFDTEKINNADFYVIKSTNDDDVHKAIKYKVWTSTTSNNVTISQSFKTKKQVFLFFSVVRSDQFLGVAKMSEEFSKNDSFKYWWEGCKWFGMFRLEWVFIKDIKQQYFTSLDIEIDALKDGTCLDFEEGKNILRVFQNYKGKGNIFSAFEFMDEREDELRFKRENDEIFKMQFDELSKNYSRSTHNVIPKKKYKNNYNSRYDQPNYYSQTSPSYNYYNNYNNNYHQQYPQYNQPYQNNYPFYPAGFPLQEPGGRSGEYLKPRYNSNAEPFYYKEDQKDAEEEEKEGKN